MGPVYTRRLFAAHPAAPGGTTIWTVPADGTYILRSVTLASFNASSQKAFLYTYMGSPAQQVILVGESLVQYQAVTIDLRQELKAGEQVSLYASLGDASVVGTGYFFAA